MQFHFGIVNHNGGEHLLACVRSILAQPAECRVTVFDNASADDSATRVEAAFPAVTVVRSAVNLGYAGALNRLLERMDEEIVVLCNMDLEFDAAWTTATERALAANPQASGSASLVMEMTDPPVINSLGVRFFADLHAQNVGSGAAWDAERIRREAAGAFGAYGAVMCFRRAALRDIAFDDDYFLFFEETDFFLRFALLGHRVVFVPDAVVRHQRSLSTGRFSTLKLYYGERNRLTTVFKLLPASYWPAAMSATLRRFRRLARAVAAGRAIPATENAIPATENTVLATANPVLATENPVPAARLPGKGVIIMTLLRAWGAAVVRLPGTLRKRRAFFRQAGTSPEAALELVRRYPLPEADLRLR